MPGRWTVANPFAAAARAIEAPATGSGIRAHFEGVSHSRLYHDWAVGAYHPDRETQWALRQLRARARDLVKNNPYATGIVEAFADNVIGWEGIRLKPLVESPRTGAPRSQVNKRISMAWDDWGMPETASADGVDSWIDLQRLLVKTWVTDGEVFVRKRKGYDNPYGYAVQLIDADLLDEGYNVPADRQGIEIRQGVELDPNGRPLAYWFWPRHPSGPTGTTPTTQRERISADEVIHYFVRYRPGQTRGFSLFAPVLTTIKMIDGISEAELVATRLAAAKMGFITNNTPEAIQAYAERLRILNDDAGEGNEVEPRTMDIEPGLLEELMPGQGFEGFDPNHPNAAFEVFLKVMLRGVARAFSMSYLALTGDLEGANYSSMRAGLLPERDHWRVIQRSFSTKVSRPVYLGWLSMASLTPMLVLPGPWMNFRQHEWRPRGWKWVDPLKDLLAAELGIALGVDSRTSVAAAGGRDFEHVVTEIAREEEFAEAAGVNVSGLKRADLMESEAQDDGKKKTPGQAAVANRLAALNGGT